MWKSKSEANEKWNARHKNRIRRRHTVKLHSGRVQFSLSQYKLKKFS